MRTVTRVSLAATVALALGSCGGMQSQQDGMSFFRDQRRLRKGSRPGASTAPTGTASRSRSSPAPEDATGALT